MSPHNYTCYSWYLAIAAFIIIAAACIAPWLFTQPGSIDFTETGQIGDTRSKECLGTLNEISGKLDTALNEHTEESIIKEFEEKI